MTSPPTDSRPPAGGNDEIIGRMFGRSLAVLVMVGGLVAAGAWWLRPRSVVGPERKTNFEKAAVKARPAPTAPQVRFTDITETSGIRFRHESGADGEVLLPEMVGAGCALLDYDGDRRLDIFFVNSNHWPWSSRASESKPTQALYRNRGEGRFEDVTEAAGLAHTFYGHGAAVGDFDNDGDPDLFVSALGANHLYRNDKGRFTDITDEAGVAGGPETFSTGCGWLDYDHDGDLDLFVGNYIVWTRESNLARSYRQESGIDPVLGPHLFPGTQSQLFRNEGGGLFSDVSEEAGIHVVNPDTGKAVGKVLGVALADLNGDEWLDIVTANDTVRNFAFLNQRNGRFVEAAEKIGVAVGPYGAARQGMGIDIADFRNDGSQGIAIGNFARERSALFVTTLRQRDPIPWERLLFTDEAITAGIGAETRMPLTFGVQFVDYDLDGRLDLLQANGHVNPHVAKGDEGHTYAQAPQLFWNCGADGERDYVLAGPAQCGPDLFRPLVARGSAVGDLDGDGDLDLVLTATGGAPRVLRNDQALGHHWLRVHLVGSKSNRDAIGARVEAVVDGRILRRRVTPTRSYLSQSERTVTFGLGASGRIETLRVVWPGGRSQTILNPPRDQVLTVREAPDRAKDSP